MAFSKGSQALASDVGKTRGNSMLASQHGKTIGSLIYYTDVRKQLNYNSLTLLYKPSSSYTNTGINSHSNGWQQGIEGTNGYCLTEVSSVTTGGILTFHYVMGQATTGGNVSNNEGSTRIVTITLEIGYGASGDTSFTSLWSIQTSNPYFEDTGNYGDTSVTFSIPSGNVLKFKVTKSGWSYYRALVRLTNVYKNG